MRIGIMDMTVNRGTLSDVRRALEDAVDMGAASFWVPNFFGLDALTTLAVVAADVPEIELGTAVVPILGRTPRVLAQQARTVHAALDGRLTLGVGLSHQALVEGAGETWPVSPVGYFSTYLSELTTLCTPTVATADQAPSDLRIETSAPLSVLAAALGPRMLEVAGRQCDGVVLWSVGPAMLSQFTVPILCAAAAAAGRPDPRVVVGVPVCVTDDPGAVRDRISRHFGQFDRLPSYRSSLGREGVASLAEIAIAGNPDEVREGIERFRVSGATDLICNTLLATPDERVATNSLLSDLVAEG
jgi:5,10-methylenetetrahydromethanopterin reductase